MGNRITNKKAGDDTGLKMSNGATSVVFSVLLLSGSDLATTQWERELVCCIAERDQSIFGSGVVGFDLDEIAWDKETFDEQKAFSLKMIDAAIAKHRWNALDYDPPFAQDQLKVLRAMVENYRLEFVQSGKEWDWWLKADDFTKCPIHEVYLHAEGCAICND